MEIIDEKRLDTAIMYLERISEGRNPVNNIPVDEDVVLNNPNVIRCMFFVRDILKQVKENGCCVGGKTSKAAKTPKEPFPLETLMQFRYSEDKPLTRIVEQINEPVDKSLNNLLSRNVVKQWLENNGYIIMRFDEELNAKCTFPTEKGNQIGIRAENRKRHDGNRYILVLYNKNAQEFIVSHIPEILGRN